MNKRVSYTKDEILSELRRVASLLNKDSVMLSEFQQHSDIHKKQVYRRFGNWTQAVKDAGLQPTDVLESARRVKRIDDKDLLEDLFKLYKEFNRKPTEDYIASKGKYSIKTYQTRWGSIETALLEAQLLCANGIEVNVDKTSQDSVNSAIKLIPSTFKPSVPTKKRQVFGEPINFRGLTFAPINEQGVVYLFGMVSHDLGYLIESVRIAFPDCEGKRCFDKKANQWEHVKIEFEYKSSNFLEHGHDINGCDIIVCWLHDWLDCPLEVLELKNTIKYLS